MRVAQAKRPGQLEGENARLRRAVAGAVVANQVSGGSGVLVVPVVWGLSGVGAAPVSLGATVPVGRATRGGVSGGRELWGWLVGLGRSRLPAVSLPCRRAWGLDGWPQAGGEGIWPQKVGPRGAAPTALDGVVCGRPAAPGSGCAPLS